MLLEIILAIVLILLYGYLCVKGDTFVPGGWPIVFLQDQEERIRKESKKND